MKHHLQFNWWKYLLAFLLPILLWTGVFQSMATPGPTQRLNVLYVGQGLDAVALQQQLSAQLPTRTSQPIRSLTVDTASLDGNAYHSILSARSITYDMIIIEESSLVKNTGQSVFTRLTQELLAQFPNAVPYTEEIEDGSTLTFGLVVYDGTGNNRFSACYQGDQRCLLFISPYSENFNALNENGVTGNDAALKAVQYLLEEAP